MKNNGQFLVGYIRVAKFSLMKIEYEKKSKFSLLLIINLLIYFKSK